MAISAMPRSSHGHTPDKLDPETPQVLKGDLRAFEGSKSVD